MKVKRGRREEEVVEGEGWSQWKALLDDAAADNSGGKQSSRRW